MGERLPKLTKRFSLGPMTLLQLIVLRHSRYSALISSARTCASPSLTRRADTGLGERETPSSRKRCWA